MTLLAGEITSIHLQYAEDDKFFYLKKKKNQSMTLLCLGKTFQTV